jgi:hypothetical protein
MGNKYGKEGKGEGGRKYEDVGMKRIKNRKKLFRDEDAKECTSFLMSMIYDT